jgi:tRNA pseudouridine55 synthase
MQGILLVDKPKDWTSFDIVNYVRKIVATELGKKPKNVKVGHTGTLDPQATGLLVVLVGKEYTKKATELSKVNKTYEVTMKLGEVSNTGDSEGEKTPIETHKYTDEEVENALHGFLGETMQIPPAFSAMKINGQRAYKLARAGKPVELEARPIKIGRIELEDYSHPYIKFVADVSSGTYIRSLVEDVAEKLGTGAYMSDLHRTKVGDFSIENALDIREKTAAEVAAKLQA